MVTLRTVGSIWSGSVYRLTFSYTSFINGVLVVAINIGHLFIRSWQSAQTSGNLTDIVQGTVSLITYVSHPYTHTQQERERERERHTEREREREGDTHTERERGGRGELPPPPHTHTHTHTQRQIYASMKAFFVFKETHFHPVSTYYEC